MPHIQVAGVVTGPGHVRSGRPCEDSFASHQFGDWTSAVVCDGCGSAKRAREGADFISEYLSNRLASIAPELTNRGPGDWLIDAIINMVAELRGHMRSKFGDNIDEYAATVVGAMVCQGAGFFVHIGDGIASAFSLSDTSSGTVPILVAQSDPQNGEYVNETFYVTDSNWIKHIRIEPIRGSQTDCLLLCTDGAQTLLYRRNSPTHNVISLLKDIHNGGINAAPHRMKEFLESDRSRKLSSDDKTLVLLISEDSWDRMIQLAEPLQESLIVDSRPGGQFESLGEQDDLQLKQAAAVTRHVVLDHNHLQPGRPSKADYLFPRFSTPRGRQLWLIGAFTVGLGTGALFSYAGSVFLRNLTELNNGGTRVESAPGFAAPPAAPISCFGYNPADCSVDAFMGPVASGCSLAEIPDMVFWDMCHKVQAGGLNSQANSTRLQRSRKAPESNAHAQ